MSVAGWAEIVAHRERLVAIARRRCPTPEDAEDVVHEAMLRAATFADLDPARLGQFLTTVTIRLCVDVYRDAERGSRAAVRLAPEREVAPSPEDAACGRAAAAFLEGLIANLPERQRDVLVDRAEGLSMSQIASRHSLTYKAAESALARARGALRATVSAALGALGLGAATVRRHPVEIAAVPVATLAVVGSVLHAPVAAAPRGSAGTPARLAIAAEDALGARHGAPAVARPRAVAAAAVAVVARPRPVAVAVAPAAPVSPGSGDVLVVGDDDSPARIRISDNTKDEPPQDTLARCLDRGVWVELDPTDLLSPRQGCGPVPDTEGDPR